MVTYAKENHTYAFKGLSTDTKPTNTDYPDMENGSTFFEMDTQILKFWDAGNNTWV